MKKFILLAALVFGGYQLYNHGFLDNLSLLKQPGAFDASGKPMLRLFVGPGCEAACGELESLLQGRKLAFERIDVSSPEGAQFGVRKYPLLQIGNASAGGSRIEIVALLAQQLGPEVLSRGERLAFQTHFDDNGRALVVLYGTEWCGYCKKQRAFFESQGIPFIELDPEKSEAARTVYNLLEGNGFPLTYVGYQRFDGYNERGIQDAVAAIK